MYKKYDGEYLHTIYDNSKIYLSYFPVKYEYNKVIVILETETLRVWSNTKQRTMTFSFLYSIPIQVPSYKLYTPFIIVFLKDLMIMMILVTIAIVTLIRN